MPWSSNATFLVEGTPLVEGALLVGGTPRDNITRAVYKPGDGERELWDYPRGLYLRERAVYLVNRALGWDLVPETVLGEGPYGHGSFQRFVDARFSEHYFTLLERPEHAAALRRICILDLLTNNGDRKSGHCLLGTDGTIWAIDHGLCLHDEPKLRTVIWDFAGQRLPADALDDLARLIESPPGELAELLSPREQRALLARATALADDPVFPYPRSRRALPWPLV